MNTLITIHATATTPARVVERPAPTTDAEFWSMANTWCAKYPPAQLSEADQREMDAKWLVVMQKLQPEKYPVKARKK